MKHADVFRWSTLIAMTFCAPVMAQDAPTASQAKEPLEVPAEASPAEEASTAAPAAETVAEDSGVLEEIVVTAQRREQSLQDVPISVTAVTAEGLESMAIDSTSDLSAVSPGLLVQRQIGAVLPYIRGVGTPNASGGQESAVALYVDGFYVPQLPALNFSFNNVERVEVLKGPQGTLFGRNATGGLIQIISRDPTAETVFRADTRYDNFDTTQNSLYLGGGVVDDLTADLAVVYNEQGEGYGVNRTTGNETNQARERGLRSTWLYRPGDRTRIHLGLDYSKVHSSFGVARQAAPGARTVDGQGPLPDFWDIRSNLDPIFEFEGGGAGLKVSHDFDAFQFVSLSGYREGKSDVTFDQDATPLPVVNATIQDDNKTLTQELQLLSAADSRLQWIVGLYLFDFDVNYNLDVTGAAAAPAGGRAVTASEFDTRSYAAYAQATYPVAEATNLTAGLRYTEDERDFSGTTTVASGTVIPGQAPPNQKENEPTWRLALDHRFNPGLLGFVSYNRGFKSGVYNTVNINQKPVDSEKVDAYEVGLKSDLLDRRLRLNGSAFYYDYQDLQVQVINAGVTVISNAAKAEIYGAEIELTALPIDTLELSAGLSVLKTEYSSFPGAQISTPNPAPAGGNAVCTSGQTCTTNATASGNDLIRAPNFTGNLTARYSIPSEVGEFVLSGAYVYNGGYYWEPDNRAKQDSYSLINAQVLWTHPNEQYGLYLFGSNLTDEKYSQFLSGGQLGDVVAAQPPRTYGLGLRLRFE